jgi:hypothetical protein
MVSAAGLKMIYFADTSYSFLRKYAEIIQHA